MPPSAGCPQMLPGPRLAWAVWRPGAAARISGTAFVRLPRERRRLESGYGMPPALLAPGGRARVLQGAWVGPGAPRPRCSGGGAQGAGGCREAWSLQARPLPAPPDTIWRCL